MATTQTLQDVIRSIVAEILGQLMPGSEAFSGFATGILNQHLLHFDSNALATPLISNATPYGAGQQYLNTAASSLASSLVSQQFQSRKDRLYQGIQGILVAEDKFNENKELVSQYADYESYKKDRAESMQRNWLWNAVYNVADPFDTRAAQQYMMAASGNLVRSGVSAGNRNAFTQTRAILEQLFPSDGTYDKRDYGYFTQTETSAVAAALTKDIRLNQLVGPAATNGDQLKAAGEKFRETVQQYEKALSPLKDIFGSDIPNMLRALEQFSGQTLAQIDPSRTRQLAQDLTSRLSTGRYSMEEAAEMTSMVSGAYSQMDISSSTRLLAGKTSLGILDSINGGLRPDSMTNAEFVNIVADTQLRQSASQNNRNTALAYSMWVQKQRAQGQKDTSFETFTKQVTAAGYMDTPMQALLKVSGAATVYELQAGYLNPEFNEAYRNGDSLTLANKAAFQHTVNMTRIQLDQDPIAKGMSQAARDKAIAAAVADPTLLRQDAAKRRAEVLRGMGVTDAAELEQVERLLTYMGSNDTFSKFVALSNANFNQQQQDVITDRAKRLRAVFDQADGLTLPSSLKELITAGLLEGKLSKAELKTRLSKVGAFAQLSDADQEEILALEGLGGTIADLSGLTTGKEGKEADEIRAKAGIDMLEFGLYRGLDNRGYREAVEEWKVATSQEQRESAARKAYLYRHFGNDTVKKYLDAAEKGKVSSADALARLYQTMQGTTEDAGDVSKGQIRATNLIRNQLIAAGFDDKTKVNTEYAQGILKKAGIESTTSLAQSSEDNIKKLQDAIAAEQKKTGLSPENKRTLQELLRLVNNAGQETTSGAGLSSPEGVLSDLSGVLKELKEVLNQLLTGERAIPPAPAGN